MQLADFCTELTALPAMAALADMLARQRGWMRIAPLIAAARTPLIAALAQAAEQRATPGAPLVYVVGNSDQALRAAEDLRQWLGPEQALLYPASDVMPYEHMSPSSEVAGQRLRVLQALQSACLASGLAPVNRRRPSVIVVPIKALLQATLSPAELAEATVVVQRGQEIPQDALIRRWIELGYRVAPTVEEPGELSRRGGIVDIWSAAGPLPTRIEWFGDEIDSLRMFDPNTQRSEERLEAIVTGPPCEIPLWRRAQATERLAAVDLRSLRREAREEWEASLMRLDLGEHFEGRPFYTPFFWDGVERREPSAGNESASFASFLSYRSLLAYLPPGALMLFNEVELLAQSAADIQDQIESQRAALVEGGELPRDFPRPYLLWEELLNDLKLAASETETQEVNPKAASRLTLVDLSNNDTPIDSTEPFSDLQ
ncbi:MAG: hypothetical protein MI924_07075, partial [Chloroflexales bacterium]|nr:hypothetical protein [Chloroflexales bacterium]